MDLIRGTILLEVPALIERLGGDADTLFDSHGIDIAAAGNADRFVSYARAAALIGDASRTLSCPDFGLQLSALQQTRMLGPIAVIVRNAETVGAAVKGASRYLHTLAPLDSVTLRDHGDQSTVAFDTTVRRIEDRYQMIERGLGTMVVAFRLMAGPDFVPQRITFAHSRIAPPEAYRAVLGAPVDFDRDIDAMHIPTSVLSRPIRNRDPAALELAHDYLRAARTDVSIVDAVESLIHRLLAIDHVTLDAVAESLSRVGLPVGRIAQALGYSEQSSYTRACRRWFGESPRSLRTRAMGNRPSEDMIS